MHVRNISSHPIVLVMENWVPHGADVVDLHRQEKVYPPPPNCTSIHQTMNLGEIVAWKMSYRKRLLTEIVKDIEQQARKCEMNKEKPAGMKGIDEGYEPQEPDVSRISKLS